MEDKIYEKLKKADIIIVHVFLCDTQEENTNSTKVNTKYKSFVILFYISRSIDKITVRCKKRFGYTKMYGCFGIVIHFIILKKDHHEVIIETLKEIFTKLLYASPEYKNYINFFIEIISNNTIEKKNYNMLLLNKKNDDLESYFEKRLFIIRNKIRSESFIGNKYEKRW